ncbi:hypothetical protein [uncultured Treponema sp.]|uniref:hypothetical protein n=1 Tax=uncultured Treponema sp. TaxID=162155 RepID=UPI0025CEFD57|nr:hypothetical protein [uncultured Treponema sp.]
MSSKDVLLYFGTEEAKVTAGQDSDCQVNLKKKDCQIYNISVDAEELKTACESEGNTYIFMDAASSVSTNQATSANNYQLTNITSGTKIIRGNGGKLEQSTDNNKTLTTEGGQIKLFNVTGSSTILEINNLTFTASSTVGTTSTLDGALIYVDDGATVILKQCRMSEISMSNSGTSLIYVKSGGTLLLENCTFYNNTSANKGSASFSECIRIENGAQVEVVSCNFETNGNDVMSNAAAIENSGSCRITNTTFKNNLAQRGGAIMNNETGILEIEDSTFDSNTCTSSGYYAMRGGAIFIQGGTVKIKDSTFTGNKAGGNNPGSEGTTKGEFQKLGGGAISIKTGSLILQNTRFDNNSVTSTSSNDAYGYGGAVLIEQSDASLFLKDASGSAMDIENYISNYMNGNTTKKTDAGANIYCNGGTINGTVYTKAWE